MLPLARPRLHAYVRTYVRTYVGEEVYPVPVDRGRVRENDKAVHFASEYR